ncbi:MAG TPA: hypothetical protein VJ624_04275 [Thermodesulfobacteriota bacterium]|nr:hypothetical protein [Thermodesulfobacteriota bacterium]
MKEKLKGTFIILAFLAGIFVGFPQKAVCGQGFALPTLRFTGTIYPSDAKDIKGSLRYQRILIENKEWILKITKAEDVYNPGKTELQVIRPMPHHLNLQEGVKGVLAPFQKPDIVGKVITIQGLVSFAAKWMKVYELTIVKEEKK